MEEVPKSVDREPPREAVEEQINVAVLPSLEEQMDESGTGDLDMRMQVGTFSHPETGEEVGEIMWGMSGKVWVEFDEGHRAVFTLQELTQAAVSAVDESELDVEYDWGEDE